MKTWQFWVIIALVLLVVVPMIYFAIAANAVAKIPVEQNKIYKIDDSLTNPGLPGNIKNCIKAPC